jgi:hypothetical protein
MSIIGALDVHRRQLTFDYIDTATGVLKRGRIIPADREHLPAWLARFAGRDEVHFALERCTGDRAQQHPGEPADATVADGARGRTGSSLPSGR